VWYGTFFEFDRLSYRKNENRLEWERKRNRSIKKKRNRNQQDKYSRNETHPKSNQNSKRSSNPEEKQQQPIKKPKMIKEEKKISKILKKRKNIQKSSSSELDRNAFSKQCIATPISSEDHDASNKMKHKKTNRNLTESHFSDVLVSPTKPNSKYSFPIVSSSSSSSDKNLEVLEKQKPTQTLNSLSETVENAIVKLKEIAVKSDFTKKKFPKELDAALYQVCFLAHKEVGFLSSHLMERLCSILPFKKNTLKTRFGKLNTLDTRAAKYQQIIEENIEKLKTKSREN